MAGKDQPAARASGPGRGKTRAASGPSGGLTPEEFIREITGSGRKPLYVLHGGEPSAVSRCLAAAEEAVNSDFRDFNHQILELEAGQARRLAAEAATMPFLTPPRVVVTKNPPFTGDDWNVLADYLDDPNPGTTIVITVDKLDSRLKFAKKIKGAAAEVDCSPPKGAALTRWLMAEFQARSVAVDQEVCALIIERAGVDPLTLLGEAEKLSLYVGPGGTLTSEQARRLVSLSPNANIFELGEALGRHDLKAALSTLFDLLATEHHLPILAMMVRHFRLMLQIKTRQAALKVNSLGPAEAADLGLHPFVLKKTQGQASAWNWRELSAALKALEEAHRALVTTSTPPQMILENLAIKLTRP